MNGRSLFALAALLGACTERAEPAVTIVVRLADEPRWDASTLRVSPEGAELARVRRPGLLALRVRASPGRVSLVAAGACRRTLELTPTRADTPLETSLEPLFEIGPGERVVGADAPFVIQALPRCPEAAAVELKIAVRGGAALAAGALGADGRSFSGRTARLAGRFARPTFGIVPVSRAEQGETELAVELSAAGAKPVSYALRIVALARASGLPNVALDHPLLLAGTALRLEAPAGSHAALRDVGGLSELVPDRRGSYTISDGSGRRLTIESARYDQVPLDCGRADCHHTLAESTKNSPMTRALASDLGGCHPLSEPSCALRCHSTGEPGSADGGFAQLARELALAALPSDYQQLPRALHRVGGVGCLACHGPSAIPRPAESWALLRSAVCAVCHDAPPRYGHAAAFASSRMATADRDPRTRRDARCAACHTTWGALGEPEREPPVDAAPFGLGCATCHDVHPHAPGTVVAAEPAASLLRELPLPSTLGELPAALRGASRVCVGCHAPSSQASVPEASAAAIVAGRGGLAPDTGAPLDGEAPHARDAKGCLSCHDAGPPGLERGQGHAFAANRERCSACHEPKPARALRERAFALQARLGDARAPDREPLHAGASVRRLPPRRARALYDVLLVLEDPAAAVHNPAYAAQLLDAAQAALSPLSSAASSGKKP